jgi:MoxR-like ATPase
MAGPRDLRTLREEFPVIRARLRERIHQRVVGLDEVIDLLLISVLAGGHCLLVGVPGLAKTLLVRTLADLLDLRFARIQFTPDLMPSDIVGAEVIAEEPTTGERGFRFMPGPVFTHLLLADEINRTPPKTQAALMEAMEERQVTVGGRRHGLERPFFVLATQNPIEQEGTYPLPAAQLDRFLFWIRVDYPARDEEREIIRLVTASGPAPLEPELAREEILALLDAVTGEPTPPAVAARATTLARRTRPGDPEAPPAVRRFVSFGVGPRGAQSLVQAAKVRALLEGRSAPSPEDVDHLLRPAFRHRIVLNFQAEAQGIPTDRVLDEVLDGSGEKTPRRPRRILRPGGAAR